MDKQNDKKLETWKKSKRKIIAHDLSYLNNLLITLNEIVDDPEKSKTLKKGLEISINTLNKSIRNIINYWLREDIK